MERRIEDNQASIMYILVIGITIILFFEMIIPSFASIKYRGLTLMLAFSTVTVVAICFKCIKDINEKSILVISEMILKDNIQQMESMVSFCALQRHEFARHLQCLQAMMDMGLIEQAQEYLDGIAASPLNNNEWHYDVGIFELSSLVNAKYNAAQMKNIDFQVSILSQFNEAAVFPWDLCSLVGNLLDNAFDAALQDPYRPKVSLTFDRRGAEFIIMVQNNGSRIKDPDLVMQMGYSSKSSEDGRSRGFGLLIVDKLVRAYGGSLQIQTAPLTAFTICLPLVKPGVADAEIIS